MLICGITCWSPTGAWAVALCCCCGWLLTASAEAGEPPKVRIGLGRAEVFAGEDPLLTVTVTAPPNDAARVIKPERAHFGYLTADLVGPDGKRVPGGAPSVRREDDPD